jgi:proline iminopeptidase
MRKLLLLSVVTSFLICCKQPQPVKMGGDPPVARYFNYSDTGVLDGGVRMIPITTPVGNFHVWTKRFGNNARIKVLLLHGGPATGHE